LPGTADCRHPRAALNKRRITHSTPLQTRVTEKKAVSCFP